MRLHYLEQGTHMPSGRFARLTFLVEPELKQQFEALCASQDITASQLMRQLLRAHIAASRPIRGVPRAAPKSDGPRRK